jgi:hypothetical protein
MDINLGAGLGIAVREITDNIEAAWSSLRGLVKCLRRNRKTTNGMKVFSIPQ